MAVDEEELFIPLQDQRVFGAGFRRKRVNFVPAGSASATASSATVSSTAAARYLAIVLPEDATHNGADLGEPAGEARAKAEGEDADAARFGPQSCEVCGAALPSVRKSSQANFHETSIAHQYCLEHSHPPSSLDRSRAGLKYLAGYGFDPDMRRGLGADGQGIRAPISIKEKHDTTGIGIHIKSTAKQKPSKKPVLLDAGKVRKKDDRDRKAHEKLRREFYANDDLDRYLGSSWSEGHNTSN